GARRGNQRDRDPARPSAQSGAPTVARARSPTGRFGMNRRHLVGAMAIALLLGAWSDSGDAASTPITACPFLITVGGTYGLANDITASGDCITVTQPTGASVTVNLNGFSITGGGTGIAIVAPNPGRKISVVGPGTIAQFDIAVDLAATTDVTVKRLTVSD